MTIINPIYLIQKDPNYLYFEAAASNGATVTLVKNGEPADISLVYSVDGKTWEDYTIGDPIALANKGDRVYLRAKTENATISSSESNYYNFSISNMTKAGGNIQYLLDSTGDRTDVPSYCYYRLFYMCAFLAEAPSLPATTLNSYCYELMFYGCNTRLAEAPKLPATTLAAGCYYQMFYRCYKLTKAPKLPAAIMKPACYCGMFMECTSLTESPELPATTLAESCYQSMFRGCSKLSTPPELPATTLVSYCYWNMFSKCKLLTETPEMPATTLGTGCCYNMFTDCTSLTQPAKLPVMSLASNCYREMFSGCTNIKLSETQVDDYQTPFRVPTEGTGEDKSDSMKDMFVNTGGTFTGTPTINTTYYGAWS